jgi:hypothetical protein
MKETHTVRRQMKTLKAQTVMGKTESTIFSVNCTWNYGSVKQEIRTLAQSEWL